MKIICIHCGEYFIPSEEAVELMEEGYINPDSINTCDDCYEMLKYSKYFQIEALSDPDIWNLMEIIAPLR